MKKWSFQAKLVAAFMLVITVVLVAIFWSASLFIRDRMLTEKQQDLTQKGSELAKKSKSLFQNIVAADPYKPDDHFNQLSVQKVTLEELLEKADVISIHCNLSAETNHLLNTKALSLMKRKPIVINTSRGEVIDEKSLLYALNSGKIHSAGLDVYENEPTTANQKELIKHPRTICTGHYAWYSDAAAIELQKRAARNLLNFLLGNPVEDCLNP